MSYEIGSVWILQKPKQSYLDKYIGNEFVLTYSPIGIALVRKNQQNNSKLPWMPWKIVKDSENITQKEWNLITGDSTFWKQLAPTPIGHGTNPCGEIALTSPIKVKLPDREKIRCNCDSRDLFWNGHKCGR